MEGQSERVSGSNCLWNCLRKKGARAAPGKPACSVQVQVSKYFRFCSSDGLFTCAIGYESSCEQDVINRHDHASRGMDLQKREMGRIRPVVCSLLTLGSMLPQDGSSAGGSSTKMPLRCTKGAFRALGARIHIFPKPQVKAMAFHVVYLSWKLLFLQSIYHDNWYIQSVKQTCSLFH